MFWKNLSEGTDCITEIPNDRWDHSLYYDADKDKEGKTYGKWGGFLKDVDKFDPQFFSISVRLAFFIFISVVIKTVIPAIVWNFGYAVSAFTQILPKFLKIFGLRISS